MGSLWATDDANAWQDSLAEVGKRLEALENPKLTELERWFFDELPDALSKRKPMHLTSDELVKIVEWKLTRGKWRPKLLDYAKAHSEDTVREATASAFKSLIDAPTNSENLKEAMSALTALKGIGPATASALLTAAFPDVPFQSDEAMAAALNGQKEYTSSFYFKYAAKVQERASTLSKKGATLTPKDVERALWSEAAQHMKPKKAAGSTKRKR
ncbi:g12992 [Coccomyxa viridis]|uniref:G12992 protein n=1 Tax=Coccomyxa viridis TaxID=1274662 RepID=A0ABP1GH96_9CHLO